VSQTRTIMLCLFLTALLGCTVGPDYRRPDMAVPQPGCLALTAVRAMAYLSHPVRVGHAEERRQRQTGMSVVH